MEGNTLASIDRLRDELNRLRPLPPDVVDRVAQKLRIEANYHSNAIEGNQLTLGETRSLILHGLTAHGKPLRDHLDIQGHDAAARAIEDAVANTQNLNQAFIRNVHHVLLREPYKVDAVTPDRRRVRRAIAIGRYKTLPNNVETSTGEIYYFAPPEHVPQEMTDLIDWTREQESAGTHPIIIAAAFHYRFVRIHPFDDGNGRMARLLMNMIVMKHGYTVAVVRREMRDQYIDELERLDRTEELAQFTDFIASCCHYALDLHLRAARGESIEDVDDIDREIALFRRAQGEEAWATEAVALRSHIEQVVGPMYAYCQSKIHLLAGVLPLTSAHLYVHGSDVDNKPFDFDFGAAVNAGDLPERAQLASLWISFTLQRAEKGPVLVNVRNELRGGRSGWDFSLNSPEVSIAPYAGRDLERLKLKFNELLRVLMNTCRL